MKEKGAKVWGQVHLKSFVFKGTHPYAEAPDDLYHQSLVIELETGDEQA